MVKKDLDWPSIEEDIGFDFTPSKIKIKRLPETSNHLIEHYKIQSASSERFVG
jgi:hypothetical protein